MPRGPLTYLRRRLARAIEARVRTATEALRVEMVGLLAGMLAQQREEQQLLDAESRRRHAELTELLNDARRVGDADRANNVLLGQQLAKELAIKISTTNTSLGSISASITDAQRRQAKFVEQLARRVEALEPSLSPVVADSTDSAS